MNNPHGGRLLTLSPCGRGCPKGRRGGWFSMCQRYFALNRRPPLPIPLPRGEREIIEARAA